MPDLQNNISMEPKSSDKKNLDDLPGSQDSDFWLGAEIHTGITPHEWKPDKGHYFERVSGHQAYCEGCGWGFELDPGDKIIDGHLYDKSGKLII